MAENRKSLLSLMNANFRESGGVKVPIKDFGAEIRALSDDDKRWYAQAFVDEGYADEVFIKGADGNEVTLATKE